MEESENLKIAREIVNQKGFTYNIMLEIIAGLLDKIDELEDKLHESNLNKSF